MESWIILCLLLVLVHRTKGISICPSREIRATEGEVTSPNYPRTYPSDSDCTLAIDGGLNVRFKIKFAFFEVEEDEDDPELCNFDVLKIVDGSRTFSYCGRGSPPDYTSSGNKISLAFKSDSTLELNGFNISFSTFNVEPSGKPPGTSICPTREKKVRPEAPETMKGALFSPKSPNFYPNDVRCTVTLDVPDNYKTVVWFEKFSLQYSERCTFDKLVLSDELDSTTQCGGSASQLPPPMEFKGKKVQIDFSSDDDIPAAGFQLKYNITRLQQGRCICTSGLSYVTIDNYKPRNDQRQDDIRFEFKTTQSSGIFMYAKGLYRDYIHVGYNDSRVFMYHIDLGTGESKTQITNLRLNDNNWHKVHLTRNNRALTITIDDGLGFAVGQTPGSFNRLDIPSSMAYFLGAPTSEELLPNFMGCIRDFVVDGHEPITNAWASKPDYFIQGRNSIRLCSASDDK